MRGRRIIYFIGLLGLLSGGMSVPVLAQGWTASLTVEAVWLQDNLIVAETSGGAGAYTEGCVASKYIVNMTTAEARNQAFSLLTTAAASGKAVRFWYKDSCLSWDYHNISAVKLVASP